MSAKDSKGGLAQGPPQWLMDLQNAAEPMPEFRDDCPCTKKKCERHGNCRQCVIYHAGSKRQRAPFCVR
jgi:hypothetical protein